jgi:hypothetical protein
MRHALVLLALSGTATAGGTRLHPVHNADGSIVVGAHAYASQQAYFQSAEWQLSGGRCGSEMPSAVSLAFAQTDCSMSSTVINPDYIDGRVLVIQVVFHVVSKSDGTGAISDDQIRSQIEILNEDYEAMVNTHGAAGTNAGVEFVLARFDPAGHPTTGIDRVTNDAYFSEGDGGTSAMKTALHWDTTRYLNLYSSGLDSVGLLGYATFPQESAGQPDDGVVVAYQSVGNNPAYTPYDLGATATHEVGHYLGLLHTFQSGCGTTTAPYTSGDLISDTNREKAANYGCAAVASGCNDGKNSPIENYMDYSQDACMTKFTTEQVNRIRCDIINYRSINTEPKAGFTFAANHLAATFTSTSTDAETQPAQLHYLWSFGDGMTSTDQNPSHTYAAAGSYDVTLEVVDPGSASNTSTQTIAVTADGNTGSGSNTGGTDGGIDDPMHPGSDSTGGGCCEAPGGGLSFALCAVPVAFVVRRRRRR